MMQRLLRLLVIVSGVCASDVAAQFTTAVHRPFPVVDSGMRVRVKVEERIGDVDRKQLHGIVRFVGPDTLYLQIAAPVSALAIPRSRIRQIDRSMSRSSRFSTAAEGGLVTAAVLATQMWFSHQQVKTRAYNEEWKAVAVGTGMGFALGGYLVWNWNRRAEVWRPARLPLR